MGNGVRITISDLKVSADSAEFMSAYIEFTSKICMDTSKHIVEKLIIGHGTGVIVYVNP